MLKRCFLPPLVPVLGIVLLSLWVVVDETRGTPRLPDGSPENAPRRAAMFLVALSPVIYFMLGLLNLLDSAFDLLRGKRAWIGTLGLCVLLPLPGLFRSGDPAAGGLEWSGFALGFLMACLLLLPMTLLRRLVLSPREPAPTIREDDRVPFDRLFPRAKPARELRKSRSQRPTGD